MDARSPIRSITEALEAMQELLRFGEQYRNAPDPLQPETKYIGAEQAAKQLGIRKQFLYSLTRRKKVKATKVGKYYRYTQEDLNSFIAENSTVGRK